MAKVRMMAISLPTFRHAGLVFGQGWQAYDVSTMSALQLAAIRTYRGRFISVHPSDADRLSQVLDGDILVDEDDILVEDEDGEFEDEDLVDDEDDDPDMAYASMNVAQLRAMAQEQGLELPSKMRRLAIIAAIEANRS